MTSASERADVIWQDPSVAKNYGMSRSAIPFVDMHFEVMHRLIDVADIDVRNVLDLGSGDGIAVAEVINRHPVERATLTDFSDPMLAGARARFDSTPLDIAYIIGDFLTDDWHGAVSDRGQFDLVVSRFAIHHIPDDDKRALYRAIHSWLAPGGMFVQIEHTASASQLYNDAHDRLMVECLTAASGTDASFDDVMASYRMRADGGANILAPVCDQLEWLRDIGFVDVDCAFKCFELAVFAGRKAPAGEVTDQ